MLHESWYRRPTNRVRLHMARRLDGARHVAVIAAVTLGACDLPGDPEIIAEGRRQCMALAMPFLDDF
ncbi:hypothetical protein [Methylobacterium nonmethylotrophicum]|uniref:Uncharacterized protein n=1 Tax=Methylobacterium nonmethylotrophicum TaxID=1141884 RepID=A0A4Z0NTT8_9HYPH|nr:hypothetical protein [Methylobacterium nonmethylotrophicum]TGE00187.1 hypothetical protein EU555_09765 [Methylobacterium nonmethylotrophicum]